MPTPIAKDVPRVSTPSSTPSAAHTARISQRAPARAPAATPTVCSRPGVLEPRDHEARYAPAAASTPARRTEPARWRAPATWRANTCSRPGPWVNSVFSASQPYSLPNVEHAEHQREHAAEEREAADQVAGPRRGSSSADAADRVLGVERVRDHVGEEHASSVQSPSRIQVPARLRSTSSSARRSDHRAASARWSARGRRPRGRRAAAQLGHGDPRLDQRAVDRGCAARVGRAARDRAVGGRSRRPREPPASRAPPRERLGAHAQAARPRSSSTVPSATSAPSRITPTRSQICSTSPIRWLESRTVRPPWASERMNVAHLGHAGRVEPVGRLVEDQQLRVLEQRGGDAESLLHPQRVGRRHGRRRGRSGRPRPSTAATRSRARRRGGRARAGCRARRGTGRRPVASTIAPIRASPSGAPGGRRARWRCRTSGAPARAASAASSSCRRRWGRGSRRPRRGRTRRSSRSTATSLAVGPSQLSGLDCGRSLSNCLNHRVPHDSSLTTLL